MSYPGGFYNSFEAALGLGLGYRQGPSNTFAIAPELNISYWFNWFGIGVTARYSMQSEGENWEGSSYHPYIGRYNTYSYAEGNQFSIVARLAVRF